MPEYPTTLVAPDGRKVAVHDAAEYNDLRFGKGYRPAEEDEPQRQAEQTDEPERSAEEPDLSVQESAVDSEAAH